MAACLSQMTRRTSAFEHLPATVQRSGQGWVSQPHCWAGNANLPTSQAPDTRRTSVPSTDGDRSQLPGPRSAQPAPPLRIRGLRQRPPTDMPGQGAPQTPALTWAGHWVAKQTQPRVHFRSRGAAEAEPLLPGDAHLLTAEHPCVLDTAKETSRGIMLRIVRWGSS